MTSIYYELLDEHYGIFASRIIEQEGGWSAQAYRVETSNGIFFLKAYDKRKHSTNIWTAKIDSYMPIVLWLHNNTELKGRIVCPVLTKNSNYKIEDDSGIYILFPYIEGHTLCDQPLSVVQANEIAKIIAKLHRHGAEIPVPTDTITEDFSVPFCDGLKEIISSTSGSKADETYAVLKEFEYSLSQSIELTKVLAAKSPTPGSVGGR